METYLIITDITGKQYPIKLSQEAINVEYFTINENEWHLNEIQDLLANSKSVRIGNKIFKTDHLIGIEIQLIPTGAF